MTRQEFCNELQNNPFTSLNDMVYQYILDQIITVRYPPNSVVSEKKIAGDLGISRTPVRNAIKTLEQEGLLNCEKGRAARVCGLNLKEYLELCDFRAVIEGEAARLAALRITGEELDKMKKLLSYSVKPSSRNIPQIDKVTLHMEFHKVIIDASRNAFLESAYNLYHTRWKRYSWMTEHIYKDNIQYLSEEYIYAIHSSIYQAMKNRAADTARSAILADVQSQRDMVVFLDSSLTSHRFGSEDEEEE